jgi:hypothetical protein
MRRLLLTVAGMKTPLCVLVAVAVLGVAAAPAASSPPPIPTLTYPVAISSARAALRHFKNSFRRGHAKNVRCGTRFNLIRVRCNVGWVFGHSTFFGKVNVLLSYAPPDQAYLFASWRVSIVRVNHDCQATGGSNCTRVCQGDGGQTLGVGDPGHLQLGCGCIFPGGGHHLGPCPKAAASELTLDPLRRVSASLARERHLRLSG